MQQACTIVEKRMIPFQYKKQEASGYDQVQIQRASPVLAYLEPFHKNIILLQTNICR